VLWITGSRGLLGSALCKKCEGALKTGHELDISSLESIQGFVWENPQITHIVNCAAFSEVDAAEKEREKAFQTNVKGPENLGKIANEIQARLIHISTDYVFDGKGKKPLREEDEVGPLSYYGMTKLWGEEIALKKGALVIRTSWLFGNGGKSFVSKLLKMLQTQKEIRLTDDQWGRFTYAPELSDAILKMQDQKGLYQYANEGITTKYEFGLAMREEALSMGYPIKTESILPVASTYFPAPCERPAYSAFDTRKIAPFVTIRHWREALRDFLCEQLPVYS
jgi:dTDP-4-dehydrorhamnose reductase